MKRRKPRRPRPEGPRGKDLACPPSPDARPPIARAASGPSRVLLRAAGMSDAGKRERNEDAYYCRCDGGGGLFIIADGMGGKAAGEAASRAVVTALPALLDRRLASPAGPAAQGLAALLGDALDEISRDLYRQSQTMPALAGLGSTAAVLLIRDGVASVAHAGDSRVYLLRRGRLACLTEDHTTAMALVRAGHLSLRAARDHPLNHSLEEYIGKEQALNPGTAHRRIRPGDRWMICSDGLMRGLREADVLRLLRRPTGPADACRDLLAAAIAADGSDNITALVIDVVKAPPRGGREPRGAARPQTTGHPARAESRRSGIRSRWDETTG